MSVHSNSQSNSNNTDNDQLHNDVMRLVKTQKTLQNIIQNQEMRPEEIDNVLSEITQTQRSSLQDAEVGPKDNS